MNRTDCQDNPAPEFASTGMWICLGANPNTAQRWTFVYAPSEVAQKWDGVTAPHALGNQYGSYSYAEVKVTGRRARWFGGAGASFTKARVRIAIGTEDEEWVDGWVEA